MFTSLSPSLKAFVSRRWRHCASRDGDERGSITMFAVVISVGLFLMVGLVVDGGGQIRATQEANAAADDAARAAGQAIYAPAAVRGEAPQIDPGAAQSAAQSYLNQAGVRGSVSIIDNTRLRVTANVPYKPIFLSLAGVDSLSGKGESTVVLVRGLGAPE